MPDAFFASAKSRKRKRTDSSHKQRQNGLTKKSRPAPKKAKVDEELSEQSEEEWGGIDDMELRAEEPDPGASGDEDEDETPAEKRLRLAQLYLDSVKDSLGMFSLPLLIYNLIHYWTADGEFDAAEIDKELISARLKQDVLEHSGKIHLFVADSVRPPSISLPTILIHLHSTTSLHPQSSAHAVTASP